MVQRDGQGPFRLGLALVTLADRVLARLDLRALARPVLVELMERTGETATLSVPGEREAITVDSVPSHSSVVSMARLGRPSVAHATAVGKVMLAFGGGPLPRERDLRALTERTITDRARARRARSLAVRQRGYGTVFGEREPDVNAIAAPVLRPRRRARGDPRPAGPREPPRGPRAAARRPARRRRHAHARARRER